jgi:hypothetical protein
VEAESEQLPCSSAVCVSPSAGIFQHKMLSQQGYSSAKCSVSRNVSAVNICSQQGYSSTTFSFRRDIPVQNVPSVGALQYEIRRQ